MQKETYLAILVFSLALITPISAASNQKFRHWFEKFESHWLETSDLCSARLNTNWNDDKSRTRAPCAQAADCLLDNTSETIKLNMASAAILLGLTPSMLSLLGPDVMDISVLSARSPLLALLLAIASPAINLRQLFYGPELSGHKLRAPMSRTMITWHGWLNNRGTWFKLVFQILEFALAGGMMANTGHVSVYLDLRTVSGWRCSKMNMPLMWSVSSIGVHVLGRTRTRAQSASAEVGVSKGKSRLVSLFQSSRWKSLVLGEDSVVGEFLFWAAALAGIVHMMFGVLVLSSLLFISAVDAIPIVIRYAVSAIICQAILLVELASMRLELPDCEFR